MWRCGFPAFSVVDLLSLVCSTDFLCLLVVYLHQMILLSLKFSIDISISSSIPQVLDWGNYPQRSFLVLQVL